MANALVLAGVNEAVEFLTAYDQLLPTERAFVDAYLVSDDPIGAVFAAWPALSMSTDQKMVQAARVRALELVKRPIVQAAIRERMDASMRKWELTADRVLAELAKITYANLDDFVRINEDGDPIVDFSDVTRDQMAAVGEVTVESYMEGRGDDAREVKKVKFKLHDKMSAIDKAMRRLGLYAPDRVEHSGPGGGPIRSETLQITADMSTLDAQDHYARILAGEE